MFDLSLLYLKYMKIYPRNYLGWKKSFCCPSRFQWRRKNERASALLPRKPGWGFVEEGRSCPSPCLIWTPRSCDASTQRHGCSKDSSAWGETQTLDRSHPKQTGQTENMSQSKSWQCVSWAFCCFRINERGRKEGNWILRSFLLPKRKYNNGTLEDHTLVKGCSGANVGCSPGGGLEEKGVIWGKEELG